ncbi:hypothetical protein PS907_00228 [Pseudomonas fluorescens]|nr:hypothetical protein PS907_00228 [Pseudomonas fluorescens]
MNIVCVGFKRMFLVWRGKLPLLALITASCWNRSFNRFESCQYRSGSMFCAKSPGLRHFPVEAGKPAPAVWAVLGQGDLCWSGPMPVWGNVLCEVSRLAAFSCGSGLARDGGVSAKGVPAGPTLSRASPLPQFGLCWGRGFVLERASAGLGQCAVRGLQACGIFLWERACPRWRCVSRRCSGGADAFAGKPAPTVWVVLGQGICAGAKKRPEPVGA